MVGPRDQELAPEFHLWTALHLSNGRQGHIGALGHYGHIYLDLAR